MLLRHGADPNGVQASKGGICLLHKAAAAHNTRAIKLLLAAGADPGVVNDRAWTPLHVCAAEDCVGGVTALLDAGADIEAGAGGKGSPLHFAAFRDATGAARALLARGAAVDARDANGTTPLLVACAVGAAGCATALIAGGADVTLQCPIMWFESPLFAAARRNHGDIVKLLAAAGADVNARPSNGAATPLCVAAAAGAVSSVTALLECGADPLQRTRTGADDPELTPLQCALAGTAKAAGEKKWVVARLLVNAGGSGVPGVTTADACTACGTRAPQRGPPLKVCTSCGLGWYCSVACQRAHWKGGHKEVCRTASGAVAALVARNGIGAQSSAEIAASIKAATAAGMSLADATAAALCRPPAPPAAAVTAAGVSAVDSEAAAGQPQ